jgi:dihydroflavonol-4-reductase
MVVITGVSGLVGANLARALLAQGLTVRGTIHRVARPIEGLDIERVQADVRDAESLRRALSGADVVYHLAARITLEMNCWPEVEAINVLGTRNVVEACLQCGVRRLVHLSSIHAFDQEPLDQPLDETRSRLLGDKGLPYDRSKALGEQEVLAGIGRGLEAVILNPTGIIGPYDYYPSYFGQALLSLVKGRIPALVRGGFDWVDVRDVVKAAIQAGQFSESGSRYILSGHWRSVRQVADLAARLTRTHAPGLVVPTRLAYLAAPLMEMVASLNGSRPIYTRATLDALSSNRQISHGRASRDLGYQPRPFEETIQNTLGWFAQNGYLDRSVGPLEPAHG